MPQQPEAGDVRAGMDAGAMGFQLIQHVVLAAAHHAEHLVERGGRGRTGHRCGEQHAGPQWPAQQQGIPRLDSPLPPWGAIAATVDAKAELQPQLRRLGGCAAGFQGVATDQPGLLFVQHRTHAGEGLGQQLLLIAGVKDRQRHDRLGAFHGSTAGPEV